MLYSNWNIKKKKKQPHCPGFLDSTLKGNIPRRCCKSSQRSLPTLSVQLISTQVNTSLLQLKPWKAESHPPAVTVMSLRTHSSRTVKLCAKHCKHPCKLPTEAGEHTILRHSSPQRAGIYVYPSRKSGLLNMKPMLDPTCRKYFQKTSKMLGNETSKQPLRTCILWTPHLRHKEEISHIWPRQPGFTFQCTAFGKPKTFRHYESVLQKPLGFINQ